MNGLKHKKGSKKQQQQVIKIGNYTGENNKRDTLHGYLGCCNIFN